MAQRFQVEAWVNPRAWSDESEAERVIEAILDSGSDDEAEWVRLAGGSHTDVASAADRERQRAEDFVTVELAAYRDAEARLIEAREALHERLREGMREGQSAYRLAQATGLSQTMIGKIRRGAS